MLEVLYVSAKKKRKKEYVIEVTYNEGILRGGTVTHREDPGPLV
jgi:hypothetical protein